MAGGGVRRGFELGASDSQGAFPERDPVRPEDVTATIYAALGLDPHTIIHDRLSREHPLVKGRVLGELFSQA